MDLNKSTYYDMHKAERIEYAKAYYQANKDKVKNYYSKTENKAKRAAYMREYRKQKKETAQLKLSNVETQAPLHSEVS